METKPFNLQSPEQIAKEYAGNKQKIAEAMQMGILDPTAGTMAGMFIDRMRSAQAQEAVPQQSIAQQVFAPPAPRATPAGLGATPQGAAMAPMGGEVMPPQGEMPMAMPPQVPGMAMGGMVPPYMSGGGLSDLPLPDGMFDEPSNGGYAGGGLVSFAAGGSAGDEDGDGSLDTYFGYNYKDPQANAAMLPLQENKYAKEYEADLLARRAPEARKARKKEDMWMALGQIGARMATTPGSLLQAIGSGIGSALPGIEQSAKERKAEEREIQKGLVDLEQGRNTAAAQKAMQLIEMKRTGIQGREGQIGRQAKKDEQQADRTFRQGESALDRSFRREEGALDRSARTSVASMSGGSGGKPLSQAQTTERIGKLDKQMEKAFATAKAYSDRGSYKSAEKSLNEYGAARAVRNRLAEGVGMPAITGGGIIKSYQTYVTKTGAHPSGRRVGDKKPAPRGNSKNRELDAALAEYG